MKHKRDLQSRVNIDTGDEVLYRDISGTQCGALPYSKNILNTLNIGDVLLKGNRKRTNIP